MADNPINPMQQFRKEAGLSVQQLADLFGVPKKHCEQWLYNKHKPSKSVYAHLDLLVWVHRNGYLNDYVSAEKSRIARRAHMENT